MEVVLDTHPDTFLTLYDFEGIVHEENDDIEEPEGGSRIIWTAPFNGDYFLEVRSSDQGWQIGSYVLNLSPFEDDYGDTPESAHDLFPGSILGAIGPAFDDVDMFRVFTEANTTYVAEVHPESHLDTVVALMDERGNLLKENDDAEGLNGGSRIVWTTPPSSGLYYLVVGSPDPEFGLGLTFSH